MPSGDDADSALAPPVARTGDDRRDPYGWIAEPTAELIDLLDAERAYYEARARAAGRTARRARGRDGRAGARRRPSPRRGSRGSSPTAKSTRQGRNSPPLYAARRRSRRIGDRPAGWSPTLIPAPSFTAASFEVSPDGTMLAWSYDVVGDERYGLRFRDLADRWGPARRYRVDLPKWRMERGLEDVSVSADRHVNRPHQVWAHTLGTDPCDGRTGLHRTRRAVRGQRRCHPLGGMVRDHRIVAEHHRGPSAVVRCSPQGHRYSYVRGRISSSTSWSTRRDPEGDRFLIVTNLDAESFRIVTAPVDAPARWNDYVGRGSGDAHIRGACVRLGRRGGRPARGRRDADGAPVWRRGLTTIWPDEPGGLVTLGRNEVFDADFVTVVQQSFIHPTRYEDVDIASGRRSLRHVEPIVGVDSDAYVQERHLAPASGRYRGARRRRAPARCRPRRQATALSVRLRVLRGVHGP